MTAPAAPVSNSPFATLLRRSRFASFDPLVRQTYFSPPSHAHRGDYGLKRPLPVTRKNSFITLGDRYDDHHNFADWTRSETQVRFMRRWEELNTFAEPDNVGRLRNNLGFLGDAWTMDSEFTHPQAEKQNPQPEPHMFSRFTHPTGTPHTVDNIEHEMPSRGNGGYGKNRPLNPNGPAAELTALQSSVASLDIEPPASASNDKSTASNEAPVSHRFLIPNPFAMSRREFRSYLKQLRKNRPQFKAMVENIRADPGDVFQKPRSDLLSIAQSVDQSEELQNIFEHQLLHKDFHSSTFQQEGTGRPRVKDLPHPNGALNYAHVSRLQTHLGTPYAISRYYPGYILNPAWGKFATEETDRRIREERKGNGKKTNVIAVAGLSSVAEIPQDSAKAIDKIALFKPYIPAEEGGGMLTSSLISQGASDSEKQKLREAVLEKASGEFRVQVSRDPTAVVRSVPQVVGKKHKHKRLANGQSDRNPQNLDAVSLKVVFTLRERDNTSFAAQRMDVDKSWPGSRTYVAGTGGEPLATVNLSQADSNLVAARRFSKSNPSNWSKPGASALKRQDSDAHSQLRGLL